MTSVVQNEYDVLVVSQFTLHGYLNGNKLDFHLALSPDRARTMYEEFVNQVKAGHPKPDKVQNGVFGAYMEVSLVRHTAYRLYVAVYDMMCCVRQTMDL